MVHLLLKEPLSEPSGKQELKTRARLSVHSPLSLSYGTGFETSISSYCRLLSTAKEHDTLHAKLRWIWLAREPSLLMNFLWTITGLSNCNVLRWVVGLVQITLLLSWVGRWDEFGWDF